MLAVLVAMLANGCTAPEGDCRTPDSSSARRVVDEVRPDATLGVLTLVTESTSRVQGGTGGITIVSNEQLTISDTNAVWDDLTADDGSSIKFASTDGAWADVHATGSNDVAAIIMTTCDTWNESSIEQALLPAPVVWIIGGLRAVIEEGAKAANFVRGAAEEFVEDLVVKGYERVNDCGDSSSVFDDDTLTTRQKLIAELTPLGNVMRVVECQMEVQTEANNGGGNTGSTSDHNTGNDTSDNAGNNGNDNSATDPPFDDPSGGPCEFGLYAPVGTEFLGESVTIRWDTAGECEPRVRVAFYANYLSTGQIPVESPASGADGNNDGVIYDVNLNPSIFEPGPVDLCISELDVPNEAWDCETLDLVN
ncbi:MAG: hypothetical protein HYS27_02455 [Deltaproteobacteria bacterium]|nr:hypothetical protein [Deltaproteobacteria bacterium]